MPTTRKSPYTDYITADLKGLGREGVDPRHVEAWMRLEHSTLDALGPAAFRREVEMACTCIDAANPGDSEALAQSYGL